MKTLQLISLFFLMLLLTNCRKDEITTSDDIRSIPDTENVKFQFLIYNNNGQPISNAQIKIQEQTFESDENGMCITNSYNLPLEGLRAEIFANGYELLIKMINGPENSTKQEKVVLQKSTINIINTGNKGEIAGGGSLLLPQFLNQLEGLPFTGQVSVKSIYLDPDNDQFLRSAPGNLFALNAVDEYQQLASLGMYSIELFDLNGNELKIPEGSTATITFPIADKHKNISESEIPLWYFDVESGLWKEDGKASVENNSMIAEVSHFTWWNCDVSYDFSELCLAFIDIDGNAIGNLDVLFSINEVSFGLTTTNAEGNVLAKIPLNQEIQASYFINGEFNAIQNIGPFDEDSKKEIIATNLSFNTISGFAKDCNGNSLVIGYGYFLTEFGLTSIPFGQNGSFKYNSPGVDHNLILLDITGNMVMSIFISEAEQNDNLELGNLLICGDGAMAKISGTVLLDTDKDNEGDSPLIGAEIMIKDLYNIFQKTVFTDENGFYEFEVLTGIYYKVNYKVDEQYTLIAAGDNSSDNDAEMDAYAVGKRTIEVIVQNGEHDSDNDFLLIPSGEGIISGVFMGDPDNDGVVDFPYEWARLQLYDSNGQVDSTLVQSDGTYSFSSTTGYWRVTSYIGSYMPLLLAADESPDPDGGEITPGPIIYVILQDGEVDADNNFLLLKNIHRHLLIRVMEDVDLDGVGDLPIEGLGLTIHERDKPPSSSVWKTDENGIVRYGTQSSNIGALELTASIQSEEYEIIDIIDTSPDDDPLILDGDLTKMQKDLMSGEWDAGNIFVVRKK